MAIDFRAPSRDDVEQVRQWRNEVLESLRTPYALTYDQQQKFYEDVVCQPGNSRWWSVYDGRLVGFVGLTNIQWENGLAEVSMILSPEARGQGYGGDTFCELLGRGFEDLGLDTIFGECYVCNPAYGFWLKMVERFEGYKTVLPRRKRWRGVLYDSMYFSFENPS